MSDEENELITAEDAIEQNENELLDDSERDESETVQNQGDESESPEIEKAKKYGHLSKDEWIAAGRNPKDWKSPEEFNKTGEVIEQLISLKKKVDQRDREIQALIDYQQRTSQREYERAKQDLEQRLNAAENDMDVKGVSHYTRELTRLEDMERNSQVQQQIQHREQAQQSFIERNQHWFNDRNPDLKNRAIEIDNEIQADINAGRLKVNSLDDIAVMIEKRIGYEHPDRVLGQQKVNRPNVSTSTSSVNKTAANSTNAKRTFQSLPQDLKDTFNVYKRINPKTTEADFLQKLKADGEI